MLCRRVERFSNVPVEGRGVARQEEGVEEAHKESGEIYSVISA